MTSLNRAKILCVDDEPHILDSLERVLRQSFQVIKAQSGREALNFLKDNSDVAILLTDQRMPEMSGIQFLTEATQLAPDAIRAILSGHMDWREMVDAVNSAKIHRFILKPWDNDYLLVQMTEAMKSHHILRERNGLEQLSITDPVTQLTNHRFFQDHLREEITRATRHSRSLSLLMIDLDHFKKYNDQFGHPEGDRLLRRVALRIQELVRSIDTVSRYGGEEFAIVMPDAKKDDAWHIAERIRTSLDEHTLEGPDGSRVRITTSLGVAVFPQHADNAADLVEAADKALYRAKGQGRNQSVVADVSKLIP